MRKWRIVAVSVTVSDERRIEELHGEMQARWGTKRLTKSALFRILIQRAHREMVVQGTRAAV